MSSIEWVSSHANFRVESVSGRNLVRKLQERKHKHGPDCKRSNAEAISAGANVFSDSRSEQKLCLIVSKGSSSMNALHDKANDASTFASPPGVDDAASDFGVRPRPAAMHSSPMHAAAEQQMVFLVDDDPGFRTSLAALLNSVGLKVKIFGSAAELLASKLPEVVSCLVLDVRMPRLSGLDLQTELAKANNSIPIIFMTGYGDVPMSVRAMKGGAVDFLIKPFRDQDMLDAVMTALERDRKRRAAQRRLAHLRSHLETLTPRELEVMALVTAGLMNKQIAGELGVQEITIKGHRGRVMRKIGARSLAELVKIAEALGVRRHSLRRDFSEA